MLPYPNDWFTKADHTSHTGRRLDLNVLAMPRNVEGKPIEPQEWNRSDGFSAGAQILTVVPGMTKNSDLVPSGLPPVTDLAMNSKPNLGVILLDATTGRQWPVWVEVDQYTQEAGPFPAGTVGQVQQDLMIHPATNLIDGHRYIVALRHLVTDDGSIATASPAFTVDSMTNFTPDQNALVARRITGTFTVPCYISPTCSPPPKCSALTGPTPIGAVFDDCPTPGQFALDPTNPDAVPSQVAGQTYQANFICNVGRAAFENHQLLRPVEYGHGLFGGAGEVNSSPQ